MAGSEDEFEPRPGRIGKQPPGYRGRVLKAMQRAQRSSHARSAFTGRKIGRGSGAGRVLASRPSRGRRVVIKSRIVRLAGKGAGAARAHLRYIQRDRVTRDGRPGELYGRDSDAADGKAFLERSAEDRHQFRFIISPEDGDQYPDLKSFARSMMAYMEDDLGTRLEWVAVDHFNTGHPHVHLLLRGVDEGGKDLVIARDYLTHGMRARAEQVVELDLGLPTAREIADRLRTEMEQERVTRIDHDLVCASDADGIVRATDADPARQSLRAGRLRKLAQLGLAEEQGAGRYRIATDLERRLHDIARRSERFAILDRALGAAHIERPHADRALFDPASAPDPLVGRIVGRGLSDELEDRHYLIVDAIDGRSHHVEMGSGETVQAFDSGAIIRVVAHHVQIREVDRTIIAVAAANRGRYDVDAHLRHDPSATQRFAETHVRRLEAMRRLGDLVERHPDGSWTIAPDHLDRALAYEQARLERRPVEIELLSPLPLPHLPDHDGATWLDHQIVTRDPQPLRDAGFGREVRQAIAARRIWLVAQDLAREDENGIAVREDMLATLRRRELLRVAAQLSDQLGLEFVEAHVGDHVEGKLGKAIDTPSGRFALIEKERSFTLVPWRAALERRQGQQLSGIMRDENTSWRFGRERSGPER